MARHSAWDVGVFGFGLGYGVSVSWEEMLSESMFMSLDAGVVTRL